MTPEQWGRVKAHFDEGVVLPPELRPGWLAALGEHDPEVRREVESLIAAHDTAGAFLDQPIEVDPADFVDTPAPPPPTSGTASLEPGTRVGDYEIRREIGRGGMGVVYLAHDVHLFRPAALKSVPTAMARDEIVLQRLRREAQAAAAVSHPGVALVYAFVDTPHGHFIASEYIPGHTLRGELVRGPLEPLRAVRIALDIVDALGAAHDAGVIHRDLKPENVLLTPGGAVKVIDFGIARLERADMPALTVLGGLQGTPGYMAPEQLVSGGSADVRADIYAVGVMLAEMLLGRHPMEQSLAGLPAVLSAIVRRCLESDRERRYGSARDLRVDLQRASAALQAGAPDGYVEAPESVATVRLNADSTSRDTRWWQFHQGATAIVYGLLAVPLWYAREIIGGQAGLVLFLVGLCALLVASILRLHLWFVLRTSPGEFARQRDGEQGWIRAADLLFTGALLVAGAFVGESRVALAVLLVAVAVGVVVSAVFIEPSTARAAFSESSR